MFKPLGYKSYGSIPHLVGSRLGPGDHHVSPGQVRIATEKARDKHDKIIVTEKLDGGNVGVCKVNDKIHAITRAGYLAETSPYKTHHVFKQWVERNEQRFHYLLGEGERVCGEWLLTAVGTKYKLPHEPFVVFDLITKQERLPFTYFLDRVINFDFVTPRLISFGGPISIEEVEPMLYKSIHGPIDQVEGAVWRIERRGKVDFLAKYVRTSKVDGKYLEESPLNELRPCDEYLAELYK